MPMTLFVMPIKKDKTEIYKAFIKECLETKSMEYKDLLQRYNLNTMRMWIHTLNDIDYAMFVHDMGDDAEKLLAGWPNQNHPFDRWFSQHLNDCYDLGSSGKTPDQPKFFGEIDARIK
jgi:hypothetical protein